MLINIFEYVSGIYRMKRPATQHLEGYQEFTEKIARFLQRAALQALY